MTTEKLTEKMNGDVRSKLQENTVILDLVLHHPSTTRTEKADKVDTTADKSWVRIKKKIFDSDEYKAAFKIELETYYWCKARALPVGLVGFFVIPLKLIGEVYEFLNKQDERLKEAVEKFVDGYEEMKKASRQALDDLYDDNDYYSANELKRGFFMERKLIEIAPPSPEKIGEMLAQVEKNKAAVRWQQAEEEVVYALRESFRDLIAHLTEQLEPSADGKKKRITKSAMTKTLEWVELFKSRNVLDDAEMNKLVAQTKKILKGRSTMVDEIRDDEGLRAKLHDEMGKVKSALDKSLEDAPRRKFFDE